jgi:hypothetical protein
MVLHSEVARIAAYQGLLFIKAYLECSDEMRECIDSIVGCIFDPKTDEDDRDMSLTSVFDALFEDDDCEDL